jgi:hypothetical protein
LWTPFKGPQAQALNSRADILGFGGAAGGGKSWLLLGLALTEHRRSIIFRRESKQGLALIDDSHKLLGGIARWNGQHSIWRNISGDRVLEFGGVKDPNDVMAWRGRPHDFIGIDEADSFLETQVDFLLGWLRTHIPGQRCRVVLCFNPPAHAEGRWLIPFFAPWLDKKHPRPAMPGELRWYGKKDGKDVEFPDDSLYEQKGPDGQVGWYRPKSRTFIPALVTDNPVYLATDYPSQLNSLPEPLRSQLLYGDFSAGLEDDPWQAIPTAWVEAAMARWTPEPPPRECRMTAMGVDVARGGQCQTVIARRHGPWFAPLLKYPGSQTPDGPSVAALILREHRDGASVNIDVIGVGSSAYDHCRGVPANPVNNAERCELRDRTGKFALVNVRTASCWLLREALDPDGGAGLMLPPDPELKADLTAPRWTVTAAGIQIEPKEKVIERIRRSPDCGDAVVLAHWLSGSRILSVVDPREASLVARLPADIWAPESLRPQTWGYA